MYDWNPPRPKALLSCSSLGGWFLTKSNALPCHPLPTHPPARPPARPPRAFFCWYLWFFVWQVMFMHAGFGMLETGCCREKNASNVLMKNLVNATCLAGLLKRSPFCNHLKHVAFSTPKYGWKPPFISCNVPCIRIPVWMRLWAWTRMAVRRKHSRAAGFFRPAFSYLTLH